MNLVKELESMIVGAILRIGCSDALRERRIENELGLGLEVSIQHVLICADCADHQVLSLVELF